MITEDDETVEKTDWEKDSERQRHVYEEKRKKRQAILDAQRDFRSGLTRNQTTERYRKTRARYMRVICDWLSRVIPKEYKSFKVNLSSVRINSADATTRYVHNTRDVNPIIKDDLTTGFLHARHGNAFDKGFASTIVNHSDEIGQLSKEKPDDEEKSDDFLRFTQKSIERLRRQNYERDLEKDDETAFGFSKDSIEYDGDCDPLFEYETEWAKKFYTRPYEESLALDDIEPMDFKSLLDAFALDPFVSWLCSAYPENLDDEMGFDKVVFTNHCNGLNDMFGAAMSDVRRFTPKENVRQHGREFVKMNVDDTGSKTYDLNGPWMNAQFGLGESTSSSSSNETSDRVYNLKTMNIKAVGDLSYYQVARRVDVLGSSVLFGYAVSEGLSEGALRALEDKWTMPREVLRFLAFYTHRSLGWWWYGTKEEAKSSSRFESMKIGKMFGPNPKNYVRTHQFPQDEHSYAGWSIFEAIEPVYSFLSFATKRFGLQKCRWLMENTIVEETTPTGINVRRNTATFQKDFYLSEVLLLTTFLKAKSAQYHAMHTLLEEKSEVRAWNEVATTRWENRKNFYDALKSKNAESLKNTGVPLKKNKHLDDDYVNTLLRSENPYNEPRGYKRTIGSIVFRNEDNDKRPLNLKITPDDVDQYILVAVKGDLFKKKWNLKTIEVERDTIKAKYDALLLSSNDSPERQRLLNKYHHYDAYIKELTRELKQTTIDSNQDVNNGDLDMTYYPTDLRYILRQFDCGDFYRPYGRMSIGAGRITDDEAAEMQPTSANFGMRRYPTKEFPEGYFFFRKKNDGYSFTEKVLSNQSKYNNRHVVQKRLTLDPEEDKNVQYYQDFSYSPIVDVYPSYTAQTNVTIEHFSKYFDFEPRIPKDYFDHQRINDDSQKKEGNDSKEKDVHVDDDVDISRPHLFAINEGCLFLKAPMTIHPKDLKKTPTPDKTLRINPNIVARATCVRRFSPHVVDPVFVPHTSMYRFQTVDFNPMRPGGIMGHGHGWTTFGPLMENPDSPYDSTEDAIINNNFYTRASMVEHPNDRFVDFIFHLMSETCDYYDTKRLFEEEMNRKRHFEDEKKKKDSDTVREETTTSKKGSGPVYLPVIWETDFERFYKNAEITLMHELNTNYGPISRTFYNKNDGDEENRSKLYDYYENDRKVSETLRWGASEFAKEEKNRIQREKKENPSSQKTNNKPPRNANFEKSFRTPIVSVLPGHVSAHIKDVKRYLVGISFISTSDFSDVEEDYDENRNDFFEIGSSTPRYFTSPYHRQKGIYASVGVSHMDFRSVPRGIVYAQKMLENAQNEDDYFRSVWLNAGIVHFNEMKERSRNFNGAMPARDDFKTAMKVDSGMNFYFDPDNNPDKRDISQRPDVFDTFYKSLKKTKKVAVEFSRSIAMMFHCLLTTMEMSLINQKLIGGVYDEKLQKDIRDASEYFSNVSEATMNALKQTHETSENVIDWRSGQPVYFGDTSVISPKINPNDLKTDIPVEIMFHELPNLVNLATSVQWNSSMTQQLYSNPMDDTDVIVNRAEALEFYVPPETQNLIVKTTFAPGDNVIFNIPWIRRYTDDMANAYKNYFFQKPYFAMPDVINTSTIDVTEWLLEKTGHGLKYFESTLMTLDAQNYLFIKSETRTDVRDTFSKTKFPMVLHRSKSYAFDMFTKGNMKMDPSSRSIHSTKECDNVNVFPDAERNIDFYRHGGYWNDDAAAIREEEERNDASAKKGFSFNGLNVLNNLFDKRGVIDPFTLSIRTKTILNILTSSSPVEGGLFDGGFKMNVSFACKHMWPYAIHRETRVYGVLPYSNVILENVISKDNTELKVFPSLTKNPLTKDKALVLSESPFTTANDEKEKTKFVPLQFDSIEDGKKMLLSVSQMSHRFVSTSDGGKFKHVSPHVETVSDLKALKGKNKKGTVSIAKDIAKHESKMDTKFNELRPVVYLEAITLEKQDLSTWVRGIDIAPKLKTTLRDFSNKRPRSPEKEEKEEGDDQTGKESESKRFRTRQRIAGHVDDDDDDDDERESETFKHLTCSACDSVLFKPFHCGNCLEHAYCNVSCQRVHWHDMGHSKQCRK